MRFAAAGAKLQFTPTNFSGAGGQGIGAAGGMSTLNKAFATYRSKAPRYGDIGRTSIAAENQKWRSANTAKTSILSTGINVAGQVKSAQIQADYANKAANKRKSGAMLGGALGLVASVGSSLLSDERCKHDVKPIYNALATLRELKPVTFHYNEEYSTSPERMHYGFIAQEYENVMPDQTYYDPTIDRKLIDTNELVAVLVSAVKELSLKVTLLEAKSALERV